MRGPCSAATIRIDARRSRGPGAPAMLATIGNGFITGQVIPVNGGLLFG